MARLPVTDQETIRTQRKGFCRVVANVQDFAKPAIEDVITGISSDNGVFLGGLAEEPSLASEDEILDFSENLYGAQGPIQGMWNIQSTSTSLTATFLKQTPFMYQLLFPDYEDLGAWEGESQDGGTTPGEQYGKIISRSGDVKNAAYFSNVCLCFEGQTSDEIGMVWRLNNVTNRADSKEVSPDGDGNISGTEMQLMAHENLDQLSGGERVPPFSVYMPQFMVEAPAPA